MSVKRVADRIKNGEQRQRQGKANRTLSLAEPNYTLFQAWCRERNVPTSEVVDQLIADFLAEVGEVPRADTDKAG